jgi:hypothetical protein
VPGHSTSRGNHSSGAVVRGGFFGGKRSLRPGHGIGWGFMYCRHNSNH